MESFQKKYMRRAKIMAAVLSVAPFVRMIALNGSLAVGRATKESDIDFFIVAKKGRLWACRFFVTALAQLSGLRRHDSKIAGRVCLNCYQTENHLTVGPKNLKNARDYANIIVFWRKGLTEKNFFDANGWIKKYRLNFRNVAYKPSIIGQWVFIATGPLRVLGEFLFEVFANEPVEKTLRAYQIKKILRNPLTKKSSRHQIFISDQELRFHPPKA